MASFGQRLHDVRTRKEVTQTELGDLIGMTKQAVSQYEHDIRKPDFDTFLFLCDYFDVTADFLLGRTNVEKFLIITDPSVEEVARRYLAADEFDRELVRRTLGITGKKDGLETVSSAS